ncbi:hypothetical protein, partial [Mailhella massiliensis]
SEYYRDQDLTGASSPRPWGCFFVWSMVASLPHACGASKAFGQALYRALPTSARLPLRRGPARAGSKNAGALKCSSPAGAA